MLIKTPIRVGNRKFPVQLLQCHPEGWSGKASRGGIKLRRKEIHWICGEPVGIVTEGRMPLPNWNGDHIRGDREEGQGRRVQKSIRRFDMEKIACFNVESLGSLEVNLNPPAPCRLGDRIRKLLDPEPVGHTAVKKLYCRIGYE